MILCLRTVLADRETPYVDAPQGGHVAEDPTRDAIELVSTREAVELGESRSGTHMQAEVGLPPDFIPPSAALAPPPVEPAITPSASGQPDTIHAAESED